MGTCGFFCRGEVGKLVSLAGLDFRRLVFRAQREKQRGGGGDEPEERIHAHSLGVQHCGPIRVLSDSSGV